MDSPAQGIHFLEQEEQPPDLEVNQEVNSVQEEEVIHPVTMGAIETQTCQRLANPRQQTVSPCDPAIRELLTDAIQSLKSRQSQYISKFVEDWLKEKAAFREEQLGELRKHAYDHFSNVLERQSHDCYITARIEFGTVTRTTDIQCKIAEKEDSETLRSKLYVASITTCEEMPQICVDITGGNDNSITLEVINKAEQSSAESFSKLGRHAVNSANDSVWNGVRKVCDMERNLVIDIANRKLETIRTAKERAALLTQDADAQFIEKLSQTEPKTSKVKRKKKVEVLSQTRPNSKRTSNIASISKRQNMGLATHRGELRSLRHEPPASQQGEYVGVRVGLAPLEAQQREALQVYEPQRSEQREEEGNKECEPGEEEVDQEREQGEEPEEANQECEQGGQGAGNESRDSEQRLRGQAMTENFQTIASMLTTAGEKMRRLRQEDDCNINKESQRAVSPTRAQVSDSEGDSNESDSDLEAWEDAKDIEAGEEQLADLDRRQPEPPTNDRHNATDTEPSANSNQRRSEPSTEDRDTALDTGPSADSDRRQPDQESIQLALNLARLSDAVERNNSLIESLVNRTMHPQPGATSSSSTSQNSDLNNTSLLRIKGRFRAPVRPTISTPTEKGAKRKVLDMRKAIREHTNTMMKRTKNDMPEPAHKEAIEKYKSTGNVEDGPSKDQFQPDFSETCIEKSLWNIRLSEIFENDYVQNHLPIVGVKDVAKYFLTYLQSLQTSHRKKTTVTNTARGTVYYEEALKRNRIEKRKQNRFNQQLSALHYHQLHRFVGPLTKMSYAALSDDDSDHEAGSHLGRSRYAIVREAWRSEELIKWLRTIDLLALGEKWGGRLVAHRGNVRRLRIHSTRSKDGVAVIELPENCYDRDWLNSLNDYERKILNVQPPLDMTFSEDERLQAARYVPLAKGEVRLPNTTAYPNAVTTGSDFDEWLLYMFGKARD